MVGSRINIKESGASDKLAPYGYATPDKATTGTIPHVTMKLLDSAHHVTEQEITYLQQMMK
ncbi:MAG: hypothetical protein ABS951_11170 [Solibacillus sp.]